MRLVFALAVGILMLVPPHAHAADRSLVGPMPVARPNTPMLDAALSPHKVAPPTTTGRAAPLVAAQVPTATTTFTGTASSEELRSELIGEGTDPTIGRSFHTATRLQDGRVLLAGGGNGRTYLRSAELYDPATGTFTPTGSLLYPRFLHTATLLTDGKVLIVGGTNAGGSLDIAELYDPATGQFQGVGRTKAERQYHTATLLPDGKVLIAGGDYSTRTATAELYDPATGTFSFIDNMQVQRDSHSATLLLDGTVLLAGGVSGEAYVRTAELYNPATGTFTSTGSMQAVRGYQAATRLIDGRVLLTGGTGTGSMYYSTAELYDPSTGTFTTTGSMSTPRLWQRSTLLRDGTVLVTGGYSSAVLASAETYDPATGTFTSTGTMTMQRYGHSSTLLRDGTVLIVGGQSTGNAEQTLASAELYNPTTRTFSSTRKTMATARVNHTATVLQDGRVLVAGGLYRSDSSLRVVRAEIYDPATGVFSGTGSMLNPRVRHTATLLPNGKVLFVGGYGDRDDPLGDPYAYGTELYDPATGQFTSSANIYPPRVDHTATLLADGTVLIAGGFGKTTQGQRTLNSATIYDPATDTFTSVGNMTTVRRGHAATLLDDGTVLITGGLSGGETATSSAERYNPATRTFVATGSMPTTRSAHTSILMPDGKVVIIGSPLSRADEYDPTTGTFIAAGQSNTIRGGGVATLLPNGQILIAGGGIIGYSSQTSAELYDPATDTFTTLATQLKADRTYPTASLLSDGSVLLVGGRYIDEDRNVQYLNSAERVYIDTTNTFTGALTVPSGWVTTATPTITFTGSTTGTLLADGSVNGGPWVAAEPNVPITTTLPRLNDGRDQPVKLRLRDTASGIATVVVGSVDIDTTLPTSKMTTLPATTVPTFTLGWSGSDYVSGIAGYDLEVRDGDTAPWTPVLTNTLAVSTTFTGEQGHAYFFRVRARDVAGNVEAWPATFDTRTEVDTLAPTGTFTINRGALATTARVVTLTLAFNDTQSPITDVRVAQDDVFGSWQPYQRTSTLSLTGGDGDKTVAVQTRDRVGNVSDAVTQTIRLDRAAGTDYEVSINDGALWTNVLSVTLRIGAPAGATEMRVSNDGGFAGAPWRAFDTRPSWTLSSVRPDDNSLIAYVRVRDANGTSLGIVQDNIFYDPLPPTGTVTVTNVGTVNITVGLAATDQQNLSGVNAMRVSTDPQFAGASWKPYTTRTTVPRAGTRVYAQFRDVAGNTSAVVSARQNGTGDGYRVFLPSVRR